MLTDGYAYDQRFLARLSEGAFVVAIDDLAAFAHPAAVVVNTAVDFEADRYSVGPETTL